MDLAEIGRFLAELRRGRGLTQAELGEKLGVTNKTVSRWETGNYLPPGEMLEALSRFYGLTINELLSGRTLDAGEYRAAAESNIVKTLQTSAFGLKDRRIFFRKKWRREHVYTFVICTVAWVALLVSLWLRGVDVPLCATVGGLLAVLYHAVLHNRMEAYVESRIFGGRWDEYRDGGASERE